MNADNQRLPASGPDSATAGEEAGRTTLDWARQTGTTEAVLREMDLQVSLLRQRRRRVRAAAAAVAGLLVAGWTWQSMPSTPAWTNASGSAVVTESSRQVLPDGSVVRLRPGAEFSLDFSPAMRRVALHKGEAFFEVAENTNRPFVVSAGGLEVRAVGTAFAVDLRQTAVEVLVSHGRVAVEQRESDQDRASPSAARDVDVQAASQTLAFVNAGNRVVVEIAAQPVPSAVFPVSEAEIAARLAWRIPRLEFSRTPLAEVITRINQYSTTRLVVDGAGAGDLRISGAIRADNVDALLQLLQSDHGIEAIPRGENEIVLRQSSGGAR